MNSFLNSLLDPTLSIDNFRSALRLTCSRRNGTRSALEALHNALESTTTTTTTTTTTLWGKKLQPFYFLNNFAILRSILTIFLAHRYLNKFATKQGQNYPPP